MTIRLANANDRISIQQFIHNQWKKGHVLSVSKEVLDYLYFNTELLMYNIYIAESASAGSQIDGMFGFIPASHYDNRLDDQHDVLWGALWRVIDSPGKRLNGLALLNSILKTKPNSTKIVVGVNNKVIPIYQAYGFKIGKLKLFASFNRAVKNFKIAKASIYCQPYAYKLHSNIDIQKLSRESLSYERILIDRLASELKSYKTSSYLINRYINNPFYSYSLWKITMANQASFLITRRINHGERSLVRVVDYIGRKHLISNLTYDLQAIIMEDAEYIEFQVHGLDLELANAGFIDLSNQIIPIIPLRHEPPEYMCGLINFVYMPSELTNSSEWIIVTGDGDQDRPNLLPSS